MPKHEIHPTYYPGGPLIPGVIDVAAEFGTAIALLEKHYMDNFRKSQMEQVVGITGSICRVRNKENKKFLAQNQ